VESSLTWPGRFALGLLLKAQNDEPVQWLLNLPTEYPAGNSAAWLLALRLES
jgi:hypothetical protein